MEFHLGLDCFPKYLLGVLFGGSDLQRVNETKKYYISFSKDRLIVLANSADPDEMPHVPKYPFKGVLVFKGLMKPKNIFLSLKID